MLVQSEPHKTLGVLRSARAESLVGAGGATLTTFWGHCRPAYQREDCPVKMLMSMGKISLMRTRGWAWIAFSSRSWGKAWSR